MRFLRHLCLSIRKDESNNMHDMTYVSLDYRTFFEARKMTAFILIVKTRARSPFHVWEKYKRWHYFHTQTYFLSSKQQVFILFLAKEPSVYQYMKRARINHLENSTSENKAKSNLKLINDFMVAIGIMPKRWPQA